MVHRTPDVQGLDAPRRSRIRSGRPRCMKREALALVERAVGRARDGGVGRRAVDLERALGGSLSTLPARSVARTRTTWSPSSRPGSAAATCRCERPVSMAHSNVAPVSERNDAAGIEDVRRIGGDEPSDVRDGSCRPRTRPSPCWRCRRDQSRAPGTCARRRRARRAWPATCRRRTLVVQRARERRGRVGAREGEARTVWFVNCAGPPSMVTSGGVRSTVNARLAGSGWCCRRGRWRAPRRRTRRRPGRSARHGDVQDANAALSNGIRTSRSSSELNSNIYRRLIRQGRAVPKSIVVTGGRLSTRQVQAQEGRTETVVAALERDPVADAGLDGKAAAHCRATPADT